MIWVDLSIGAGTSFSTAAEEIAHFCNTTGACATFTAGHPENFIGVMPGESPDEILAAINRSLEARVWEAKVKT